jgi:hypothetical protein
VLIMMFFMAGRSLTGMKIGGLYSALGASAMLLFPGIGPKDPWLPLIFLILGGMLDYSFYLGTRMKVNAWLLAFLAGGIAYTMIPVCRILIQGFTGFPYTEFTKHGYLIPMVSHFIMGAAGSLLGAAPVILHKKKRS